MMVFDLLQILSQYRPSTRLILSAKGQSMIETNVADLVSRLLDQRDASWVAMFGLSTFILRERVAGFTSGLREQSTPFGGEWLELDAR